MRDGKETRITKLRMVGFSRYQCTMTNWITGSMRKELFYSVDKAKLKCMLWTLK